MSSKAVFRPALVISSLLLANVGYAEQAPPVHEGPWPIRNGRNYQPTENELRALHLQDVTPDEGARDRPTIQSAPSGAPCEHLSIARRKPELSQWDSSGKTRE